jgi:hypothetical protein
MLEARCAKCGETFNPADETDLEHGLTEAEEECGGAGEIIGEWQPARRVAVAFELVVPADLTDDALALALDSVLDPETNGYPLAGYPIRRLEVHPDPNAIFPTTEETNTR